MTYISLSAIAVHQWLESTPCTQSVEPCTVSGPLLQVSHCFKWLSFVMQRKAFLQLLRHEPNALGRWSFPFVRIGFELWEKPWTDCFVRLEGWIQRTKPCCQYCVYMYANICSILYVFDQFIDYLQLFTLFSRICGQCSKLPSTSEANCELLELSVPGSYWRQASD